MCLKFRIVLQKQLQKVSSFLGRDFDSDRFFRKKNAIFQIAQQENTSIKSPAKAPVEPGLAKTLFLDEFGWNLYDL